MTQTTKTLSIEYTETDDELYCQYGGQHQPQPVLLCLDTEDGTVSAYYSHIIGNGSSMRAFHGLDIEWEIPAFRVEAFRQFVDGINADLQTILDGASVEWDGNNHVGRLDDDARDAVERVYHACDEARSQATEQETWSPWDAADWFSMSSLSDIGLSPLSTDEEVEAAADHEIKIADAVLERDDVIDYLTEQRDNEREDAIELAEVTVDVATVDVEDAREWQADISVAVTLTIDGEDTTETVYVTVGVPDHHIDTAKASGHVPSEVWANANDPRAWLGALVDVGNKWGEDLDVSDLVMSALMDALDDIEDAVERC